MPWDLSRRVFLRGAGLAALGVAAAPSSLLVRAAEAAQAGDEVLVHVFLRGGADGLNLLAPYGDPLYYALRPGIGLPAGGVVALDSYFGLNPALAPLKALYDDGLLAFVHAVGNYSLTRSHFDAQDFMETGTPGDKSTATGWLDRTIGRIAGSEVSQAVAFSSQEPRAFLGGEPVLVAQSLQSFDLRVRTWKTEAETILRRLYQQDGTRIGTVGRETFEAIDTIIRNPAVNTPPQNGASYPAQSVGSSLRQAAALVRAGLGTRAIFVNVTGGFDTHANQLNANTNDFTPLGQALAAFAQDLGPLLSRVVLTVNTEFGRAAYENGSAGTDHGSAHCMIVLGGRVRGGRVHGTWPGLAPAQLYQERDLAVGTDFRDVFAEVVRKHLGVDTATLFPGYTPGAGPGVLS